MRPSASTRRIGRPPDQHLTERLLASTVHLLAERGLPLSADKVATHARAGKAAIYRRWPDVSVLVSDAVRTCSVIPPAPDTGSAHDDLMVLLSPLDQQLSLQDRAMAATAGWVLFDEELAAAVTAVVHTPLHTAVTRIIDAHRGRGVRVPTGGEQRMSHVTQALWWNRYVDTTPTTESHTVPIIVHDVLMPLLQP